ncbi:hypothetical protein DFJ74DRAFT_665026 [Hyaloraphidium curvatum]|nr:hypothetical protein DFJ74DRAFT_665026 [Hyaloraphidium curvatum]
MQRKLSTPGPKQRVALPMASYSDGFCALDASGLVIKHYFFPAGSKTIPLADIAKLWIFDGPAYRISGSGDFTHWWALDMTRFGRATPPKMYLMIGVHGDGIVKCFSCDDGERFLERAKRLVPGLRVGKKKVEGLSIVEES